MVFYYFFGCSFVFSNQTFFVLKNSSDVNVKIICLGLIGGFVGLSFLGDYYLPYLIKYKTNALIVFLFGYIQFEREKILISDIQKNNKTIPDLVNN